MNKPTANALIARIALTGAAVLSLPLLAGAAAQPVAPGSAQEAVPPALAPAAPAREADPKPNDVSTLNRLNFERSGHDFGEVLDNELVHMEFPFNITGTHPVRIKRIHPSCGCTAAEMVITTTDANGETVEKVIPNALITEYKFQPGTTGVLRASFDPEKRPGVQNKRITIYSTDTFKPTQVLKVSGSVREIVAMDPPVLGFGSILKGNSAESSVVVMGLAPDFKIETPAFSMPGVFTAEVIPGGEQIVNGKAMQTSTVKVRVASTVKPGRHNARMIIRTNDPRKPVVEMPVYTVVEGDVRVSPQRISFGLVRVGDTIERAIQVRHRTGKPFEVTKAEVVASGMTLEATVTPANEQRTQWAVLVKGTADTAELRQSGSIRISTNVKDEELIEIPLVAVVRASR